MTKITDLHKKWMKDPAYRKEYDALEEEFALVEAIAKARIRAGLSQAELARRMKTTQSTIARLESGRGRPSTRTLDRFAKARGTSCGSASSRYGQNRVWESRGRAGIRVRVFYSCMARIWATRVTAVRR